MSEGVFVSPSTISLSTLRRRAARKWLRVWKVSARSRHHWECGPFALVDAGTSAVLERG